MPLISNTLEHIQKMIREHQTQSCYAAQDIKIVAVTKTVDVPIIRQAIEAGITAVGENRVQEIMAKYGFFGNSVEWHLIGHLQTNKVKYIIDKVSLIHSLDRLGLAEEIDRQAQKYQRITPVLIQVNVAEEASKYGIRLEDTVEFVQVLQRFSHLQVQGLMTIAPLVDDAEEVRPVFRKLREKRDELVDLNLPHVEMKYLSMGMTNDFHIAVEEGANILRIGSAIFGQRIR